MPRKAKGMDQLARTLLALPDRMAKGILRSSLRQGANVVLRQARADVPVEDGALRKSLRVTTGVKRRTVQALVQARAPHAHLAEFGTAPHSVARGAELESNTLQDRGPHHPGARAQPFLRPALDSNEGEVLQAVATQMRKQFSDRGIDVSGADVEAEA